MQTHVHITPEGVSNAIYNDNLAKYILHLEGATVQRVSYVEPDNTHKYGGNWYVDMSPIGGIIHHLDEDGEPFITRDEALAFELRLVNKHFKLRGSADAGHHKEDRRRDLNR